jgi:DNA-binding NtrC family response regulator
MNDARLLIVDDNEDVLTALRLLLKERAAEVHTARSPEALPSLLAETRYDAILLDMNFREDASSGKEGFRWLREIQRLDPEVVVLMITAYGDVQKAVRAMKAGAADFIVKPWDNDALVQAVRAGVRLRRSRQPAGPDEPSARPDAVPEDGDAPPGLDDMIGQSARMQEVFETIEKVAGTDANVLVLGENGTGKELAARAVHRRSGRASGPFVPADLGALSESLFESELFGHAQGAFTGADEDRAGRFEKADGGTLFLDEIGNIPLALQAKLLTVLQRREVVRVGETEARAVDLRLVAATNRPVYDRVEEGRFRQDLLYRINTVELEVPPLRKRTGDLPLLARHFLAEFAEKYDRPATAISEAALEKLEGYAWPGNVRELRHTIERAVILGESETLAPEDFALSAARQSSVGGGEGNGNTLAPESLALGDIEKAAVRKALSRHGGNVSQAAEALGISRKALYRRIEKYGL